MSVSIGIVSVNTSTDALSMERAGSRALVSVGGLPWLCHGRILDKRCFDNNSLLSLCRVSGPSGSHDKI